MIKCPASIHIGSEEIRCFKEQNHDASHVIKLSGRPDIIWNEEVEGQ